MARPLTIASCALFGVRPERDRLNYYRLLLNDLAAQTNLPIALATNQPDGFDPRMQILRVESMDDWRARLWNAPDYQAQVVQNLNWKAKNRRLAQFENPAMIGVYLAKMALLFELGRRHGDILWIDAGLLFSAVYQHDVPENWVGYSRERIEARLLPLLEGHRDRPLITKWRRKRRLFRTGSPHFHGMSYRCMETLASRFGANTDGWYTAAGVLYLPAETLRTMEAEFQEIWHAILNMERMGTEENVLSVQRWRHRWDGLTHDEWVDLMSDARERLE